MFGCVWCEQGGEGGIFQKTHLLWKVFFFTISDLFIDLFLLNKTFIYPDFWHNCSLLERKKEIHFWYPCNWRLFETSPPPHPHLQCCHWGSLVNQQLLILLRSEETTKGVFLHQGEDPLLGQVKGRSGKIHQVPQGDVFGEVINVDLCSQQNGRICQSHYCLLTQFVQDETNATSSWNTKCKSWISNNHNKWLKSQKMARRVCFQVPFHWLLQKKLITYNTS